MTRTLAARILDRIQEFTDRRAYMMPMPAGDQWYVCIDQAGGGVTIITSPDGWTDYASRAYADRSTGTIAE